MLLERLFDNLALTAEAFATCTVAPGWRLRLPPLDWVTVHFVVQGSGRLRDSQGTVHALPRDALAIVPAHLAHALECGPSVEHEAAPADASPNGTPPGLVAGPQGDGDLVAICGRVQATYGEGLALFAHLPEVLILEFARDEEMRGTFAALLREHRVGGTGSRAMMSALMNQCLVRVFRRLCGHPDCRLPWLLALEDPTLARALDAILTHPERRHTVESLARLAALSRSAFAKRFHDSFGRTPMDYVREVRLRRGAQLLTRNRQLSLDAIAHRVGFSSRSQFSHAFRGLFGCSPTAFRTGEAPAARLSPAGTP